MKKMFVMLCMLCFGATFGFAFDGGEGGGSEAAIKVLDMIFLGAKVIGAIAIIMGIIELLVEKDQGGQSGKKVTGAMKLGGGILLLLAATFISWMVGDPDSKSASSILG